MVIRERYEMGLRGPPGYSLVGPSRLFLSEYPAQTSAHAKVLASYPAASKHRKNQIWSDDRNTHRLTAPSDGSGRASAQNVGVIGCGGTSNIASHSAYSLGTFGLGKRMLKSSLPLLVT